MHQHLFIGDKVVMGLGNFKIIYDKGTIPQANLFYGEVLSAACPEQMAGLEIASIYLKGFCLFSSRSGFCPII